MIILSFPDFIKCFQPCPSFEGWGSSLASHPWTAPSLLPFVSQPHWISWTGPIVRAPWILVCKIYRPFVCLVIYNCHRAWNIWVGLFSLWLGYLHFHDPSPTSDSGHSRRLLRECFERIHVVEFLQNNSWAWEKNTCCAPCHSYCPLLSSSVSASSCSLDH